MANIGKIEFFSLDHDNQKIEGQENIKAYITCFYKDRDDISQVITLENEFLIAPYAEEKV
jgi:hypothetical protein